MYKSLIALAACIAFTALPAQAQQTNSGANSQSSASQTFQGSSTALAASQGGSVIIAAPPSSTRSTVRQEGSTTNRVENAPSLGGLAVGGGHPCAWTPGSGQISIIGGGFGAAGMTIDEACMLAVMAAASGDTRLHNAALYIIASRDRRACLALRSQGLISSGSCGDAQQAPATASTSGSRPALEVRCDRENGRITPRVSRAVANAYSTAEIQAVCRG